MKRKRFIRKLLATALTLPALAAGAQAADEGRVDYLSFAQGALPLSVGGNPAARVAIDPALQAIDGNAGGFSFPRPVDPALPIQFVYELPLPTTFDRFAIPDVLETPSPSPTFVRDVTVEARPIADNGDESGRSMNRRVEVHCRTP